MADNNYKKALLQHLIAVATGGAAGKGLHEVINGIKNAISAYKNFAREWDNIEGVMSANKPGVAERKMDAAKTGATPGAMGRTTQGIAENGIPLQPPANLRQMPPTPNLQPMGAKMPPQMPSGQPKIMG